MAGISSKALKPNYVENKYRYNDGTELANKEFSDGSGLEMYETDFRGYDPQIGRFWQIDPFGEIFEEWSPYTFGFDNPVVFNDPLGLSADSTSSKSNHHSRHHHHKPKYKELAPVTVVGYKKDCKTCGKPSPTVKVGPAPNKPQPLNYINWPNSTPEERAVWKTNQSLYFDRVHSGALLIQGGETQQYLNSLAMYQQWTQADQDYKTMQIAAVGIIFGPWTLAEVGVAASYVNYAELADQAYFYTELGYNVLIRDLILSFRQGMAGRLSIDQLIRLEKLANQYRGLNKVLTPKNIERVLKEINKVLKH